MSEEKKVSRRKYVAYAGAGVVVVAAAAAGGYYVTRKPATPIPTPTPTAPAKPTPTPTPTPTAPAKPEIIEWGIWSWGVELVNDNARIFNENNPDVQIKVTDLGSAYDTALYARYAADDPPDIFYATPDIAYTVQFKKWAVDMEDYFPEIRKYLDDMYPGVREFYVNPFTGKVHGLCYWLGPYVFAYNKRHIEAAGFSEPPKTYDEVVEQAIAIKKKGITKYPIGCLWSWGFPALWYQIMIGFHEPKPGTLFLFDEDLNPIFNDKGTPLYEAMKWFLDRIFVDETLSPGVTRYDESGVVNAMGGGDISFSINMPDYDVAGANISEMKETGNITITLNPGTGYAVYHPTNYSVSTKCAARGSKAQEAAWRVMQFTGGKTKNGKPDFENGEYFVCHRLIQQYGVTSAYKPVMEDPRTINKLRELNMAPEILLQQYGRLTSVLWRDPHLTPFWSDWFSSPASEMGGRVKPKFEEIMTGARGHSESDILNFLNEIADDWKKLKKEAGM